jgi:hypothetical protein
VIDAGLDRVRRHADLLCGTDLQAALGAFVDRVYDGGGDDDITALAVRADSPEDPPVSPA